MTRVIVAEIPENAGRDLSIEQSILGPDVELVQYSWNGNEEHLVSACRDADAVLTDYAPFTRTAVEKLQRCQLISVAATGYDSVDLEAVADANISVCVVDEYCTEEVADHVIMLMLALCRRLIEYHDQVQRENIWQCETLTDLSRMRDMTLGIVGFGRIGQAVARRARGFGMIAYAIPIAAFVLGGVIVAAFLRRQSRLPPAAPASALESDPELERLVDEELTRT